ncbi:MAG: methanogenesis-associated radical SAM protein, partial [Methanocorpusculum sp.]|nr:methanogenesis-associated radical SAM protein [Methanocorpusculum sp.]
VNDGQVLEETLCWLEKIGVRGGILMRFANRENQGLILDNAPVIENQRVHTTEEFAALVASAAAAHPGLRLSGTPLFDPLFDSPFAIRKYPDLLSRLPRAEGRVSVVTGSVAAPFIADILEKCGGNRDMVVPADKEIACLITIDDLKKLNPETLTNTVIIPGRAFVHDMEAEAVLGRFVVRGPEMLTADGETSMGMKEADVLTMEMEGFSALIQLINQYGA